MVQLNIEIHFEIMHCIHEMYGLNIEIRVEIKVEIHQGNTKMQVEAVKGKSIVRATRSFDLKVDFNINFDIQHRCRTDSGFRREF